MLTPTKAKPQADGTLPPVDIAIPSFCYQNHISIDCKHGLNRLRDHYRSAALEFTLDGNLIGDIGEAVAAELFGLMRDGGR